MSPTTGEILQEEIAPRLRSAIPNAVHGVGAEDSDELVQDAIAMAARLMENNERAGKQVTPGNVAYYTVLHVRSGRRSTGASVADVMASGTQLSGRSRLHSLEEVVSSDEAGGEIFLLHDVLSDDQEDPSVLAARRLDWESFWSRLTEREQAVVEFLAEGKTLRDLTRVLGGSDSATYSSKQTLLAKILEFMGPDILVEVRRSPRWRDNLDASREKAACRYDRLAA